MYLFLTLTDLFFVVEAHTFIFLFFFLLFKLVYLLLQIHNIPLKNVDLPLSVHINIFHDLLFFLQFLLIFYLQDFMMGSLGSLLTLQNKLLWDYSLLWTDSILV